MRYGRPSLMTSTRLLPTTFPDPEIESTLLAVNNPDAFKELANKLK